MSSPTTQAKDASASGQGKVEALYRQLLQSWNQRDAPAFAALFEVEGSCVGFDGSQMNSRSEIETTLSQIFANHPTAPYVGKVRSVQFLGPEVAIVHAVAGMVPPGQSDLNPSLNAIQTLVAFNRTGDWRISLFQNTPAQFHGRPELVEQLTQELREADHQKLNNAENVG